MSTGQRFPAVAFEVIGVYLPAGRSGSPVFRLWAKYLGFRSTSAGPTASGRRRSLPSTCSPCTLLFLRYTSACRGVHVYSSCCRSTRPVLLLSRRTCSRPFMTNGLFFVVNSLGCDKHNRAQRGRGLEGGHAHLTIHHRGHFVLEATAETPPQWFPLDQSAHVFRKRQVGWFGAVAQAALFAHGRLPRTGRRTNA